MATRSLTVQTVENNPAQLVTWTGLLNGDDGAPFDWLKFGDRSVQFTGTPGAAGSIRLEGSNDGTNWAPLTDPNGNDIIKAAAALEAVTEVTRWVRPRVTAGDGTTNWTVILLARK